MRGKPGKPKRYLKRGFTYKQDPNWTDGEVEMRQNKNKTVQKMVVLKILYYLYEVAQKKTIYLSKNTVLLVLNNINTFTSRYTVETQSSKRVVFVFVRCILFATKQT